MLIGRNEDAKVMRPLDTRAVEAKLGISCADAHSENNRIYQMLRAIREQRIPTKPRTGA